MANLEDRRPGIGDGATVRGAGRAQVGRDQQSSGGLEAAAQGAQEEFRPALEPAHLRAQRGGRVGRQRGRDRGADTVDRGIAPTERLDPEGATAPHAVRDRVGGSAMIALGCPPCDARREIAVGHAIHAIGPDHFHVVDQVLAWALRDEVEAAGRNAVRDVVHSTGKLDHGPGTLARFIAVGPVRGLEVVGVRVDEFETAAQAITPLAPAPARSVGEFVHLDVDAVGFGEAEGVRDDNPVGHGEGEPFAAVAQRTVEIAEHRRGGKRGVSREEVAGPWRRRSSHPREVECRAGSGSRCRPKSSILPDRAFGSYHCGPRRIRRGHRRRSGRT